MKWWATSFLFLAGIVFPAALSAQYSNSWINFSQTYYKIPIAKNGIYRLTYANLQSSGFPVGAVDPRFIKIYHRGQEQSIYVRGQADGVFNNNDYIEFFGQKNDGTLDSLLYRPSALQPHKYYNLYSDTTAYFLTYAIAPPRGLRMDSVQFVNVSGLPAEAYQNTQRLLVNHDQYSAGLTLNDVTQSTYFDQGEGWTGVALQQSQSASYTIDSLVNGVTTAGSPTVEIMLVGRDFVQHNLQVNVGPTSGPLRTIASPSFIGFQTYIVTANLNWSDIGADGKLQVQLVAASASTQRYQASVSYVKVTFPQSYNFSGVSNKAFQTVVNPGGTSYVSISNASAGMRMWDVTNMNDIVRILPFSTSGNSFNAIIPGTSAAKNIIVSNTYYTPVVLPVSFRKINPASANFVIISNKILQQPALSYANPVKSYAGYRASAAGGSYDTLVVNIDQLYNQFNYGETSSLAIYSFMNFMVSQGNIQYLFLIGKGRDITYSAYQRLPVPPTEYRDLIPSAGYPGGDAAFTAHLGMAGDEPAVPTGRLPATSAAQVAAYLNKIMDHESKAIQPWMKNILHLSGGGYDAGQSELSAFRAIMNGFAAIAQGPYLGGMVSTISKQTIDVQKINVSTSVNQGVNLVTFFGHSSSQTIDIDIGNVDDPTLGYNNPSKYPVFLINGCNAGTIFANEVTFGENWLLASQLGSRNFIGSTSFGYTYELQTYSDLFYSVGFGDSTFIKKGIGNIQQQVGKRLLAQNGVTMINTSQVQQMVLSGDPAVKLFGTNLPDYSINNGSLSVTSLDGKPVTSISNSFALKIIVKNLGSTNTTPLKVRVIRTFNDNSTQSYDSTFASINNTDTLTFILHKGTTNGFGNNVFTVVLDPLNAIKEISKANNTASLSYFIPSNGTLNLYPPDFGIVSTGSVNMLFQDANLLGQQRNFILQIDTVNSFNSPYLKTQTLSGKVLVKQAVILLPKDSVVYYWRTRPAPQSQSDSSNWTGSSFVNIFGGPTGWAQTKFAQVTQNALTHVASNNAKQKINFVRNVTQVTVKSIGATSASPFSNASIQINGVEYDVGVQVICRPNTLNLVAFNRTTALPYAGVVLYNNDPRGCGLFPSVINSFLPIEFEAPDGINLLSYVDNVSPGDSVILFTEGNAAFSTWSSTALTKLNNLGIANSQITSLQDGEPVIIFAKKGAPAGTAKVVRSPSAPSTSVDLSVAGTITGGFSSGFIKSSLIGPANRWNSFVAHSKSTDAADQVAFSIFGESLSGQETLLQANAPLSLNLSFINPVQYPQLKIQMTVTDTVNLTAPQLRNWFVFFDPVAEGLLYYNGSVTQQTLHEGQHFTGQYGFVNISPQNFTDSLLVQRSVLTQAIASMETQTFKIKQPAPGDTTKFAVSINTVGKAGLNDVTVFVNPKILPEQRYDNNVITLGSYLNVLAYKSAPSLDITVDGRYLQNGDFVSPSPLIKAKLIDGNPFMPIQDTTHLNLFLTYPCASSPCPTQRISFSRQDVSWTPATAGSDFSFSFHPQNLPEGIYTLQATGSDESGNISGTQPYAVNFQVKDETTLLLQSVYPNPSSDLFNFNFVLSGNVLPDEFLLQLFSDEGKLLAQFDRNEVGHFIIGNNILPWSATQSNLPSGLVIFRLTVSVNGKTATQTGKLLFIR